MFTEHHTITVTKLSQRALREGKPQADMQKMVDAVNSQSQRVAGWVVLPGVTDQHESSSEEYAYEYTYTLSVEYNKATEADSTVFDSIVRKVAGKAPQPQFNRWTLTKVDDDTYQPKTVGESDQDSEEVGYAAIGMPDDFDSYFSHLYGLDNQVKLVKTALETALDTNWLHRFNVVLHGKPGCGKSEVALSLKKAVGEEAVWSLDATAMTSAGIIKELSEREVLPRIVVLEEAEKGTEDALRAFIALLDTRGEIRKVTARGSIQRDVKLLCIATVNDMDAFKRMLKGALASRFQTRVFHPRPGRETLTSILQREIEKVGGNYAWAEAALDFCDEEDISDPRRVIAICMAGRDMLLTGEYQDMLRATTGPDSYDSE